MTEQDLLLMEKAILLAEECKPKIDSTPKVGAIIAIGGTTLGRGRRGAGDENDDEHAEFNAFEKVDDKTQLPQATLYTTLEPCTREVRTKELECCTELILQYGINRVFIGILDPNQGVTGKGLWKLQDLGVEVELFPPDLAWKLRAINTAFIRSQQTLGATIVSPKNGELLKTYTTGGKHTIQLECLNAPTDIANHLIVYREGLYYPQWGPFRHIAKKSWEINAHFGATGEHTLHIVTVNELGRALIQYYRKVTNLNIERRKKLQASFTGVDLGMLGGDYFGIEMTGLPKGIRSEASVTVTVAKSPMA
jgi:pyrimidine deaminase RibD-like protein